ncbi:hypothetical protein BDV12DRAFT_186885 [Aspergillus spectabilis]
MPLKVIVVGAGLAGLGAAIALNRAGHEVVVLEQSGFSSEVGAAIHVAPNASRILRDWGCNFDTLRAVPCDKLQVWDAAGKLIYTPVVTKDRLNELNISDEWLLTHRVDLHNTLRATADQEVDGRRVTIWLSSHVASVNAENGVATLENGNRFKGDLIIGADGIHSRTVISVTGEEPCKENTGQNCFRFLIPIEKMLDDPLTASLVAKIGLDGVHAFASEDRRLIVYPCREGRLLNCAGIHPFDTSDTDVKESSWLSGGDLEQLLETYQGFSPELQAMCRKAEDLKLWRLASRTPPKTFVRGKLALVGDAAHPTLPHQGQGGAQSFEDGAALGALFTPDTTPEQVSQRLELYNQVRYDHAVTVLFMSKTNDERRAEMFEELQNMLSYAWLSYPGQDAQRLLATVGPQVAIR